MDFMDHLLSALRDDTPSKRFSPTTRAIVRAYFDGSVSEAKRYADHRFKVHSRNPGWVIELAAHE